jgi:hypothetical protein
VVMLTKAASEPRSIDVKILGLILGVDTGVRVDTYRQPPKGAAPASDIAISRT